MKMRIAFLSLVAAAACALATPAAAAFNVFACEPVWAALATELSGERVSAFSATTARQDPHQVQARPALIARVRGADLLVCSGAELEAGWLPILLRQGGNAKVQPGQPGHFIAAEHVRLLDAPTRLDRAEGDIHAAGNPHVQTDPRNIRAIAVALSARLAQLDSGGANAYRDRTQAFLARWDAAIERWSAAAAPLKGVNIVVYHKSWSYLENWLGLKEVAQIEPKPGVPPGPAHLAQLLEDLPRRQVKLIVNSAYEDRRPLDFLSERSRIPAVTLPFTVGGTDAASDLFKLFDDTVQRLLAGLTANGR
jgi:zinc/manganese transport system substrate-binding protein